MSESNLKLSLTSSDIHKCLLNLAAASRTGWVQKGLYSAAQECMFDGVSFTSSERNGCDIKGLSVVLQDVKCPLPVTCGDSFWLP